MEMMRWKLAVVMAVGISVASIMFQNAYAMESNGVPEWQLIYVKAKKCMQTDVQVTTEYNSIVTQYLKEYQFESTSREPLCLSVTEYDNLKSNFDADLTILVYGPVAGMEFLGNNYLDGVYVHQGSDRSKNHTIMMCDCSKDLSSFEATSRSWVLSHELSHFVLSYKGYTYSAVQDIVHSIDKNYNSCVNANFANAQCDDVRIKIHPDGASRDYIVMKPYDLAVGKKMVQYISNDLLDSKFISLQKEYTKLWISNKIDDATFEDHVKNWVNLPPDNTDNDTNPYLFIPNGFVIADVSLSSPSGWHDIKNSYMENVKNVLTEHLPALINEEDDNEDNDIPTWFKTRARLWSQDRISDSVYFAGLEHLIRTGIIHVN